MSNELVKSIPLTLSGAGADMSAIPASQEDYYAHRNRILVTEYPTSASRYYGRLSTDPTNSTSIGQYTDTFFNQAVGTHPGSSISVGSTTTTLYQNTGDSVDAFAEYHRTVAIDSSGDIFEMDSDSFYKFGYRLLETALTGEYGSSFRLGSSLPSSDYTVYEASVFQDTLTNGSTPYNLYRKQDNTNPPSPPTYYTLQLVDPDEHHIQEMTQLDANRSAYFAMRHAEQNSGLGDYLLLPAGQTPVSQGETGTWVARGTALDTRNTTENLQYTTVKYTSPQYSTQYTRVYSKQYTGVSFAAIPGNFSGVRPAQYEGARTFSANYGGSRNYSDQYAGSRNYSDQYAGSRNYGAQYAGTRSTATQFAGTRSFAGTRQYAGTRNYIGQFTGQFTGTRQFEGSRNFAAQYAGQRTVSTQFTGTRPVPYTGARYFSGTRLVATFSSQQFGGSRNYSAQYSGIRSFEGTRFFVGNRDFTGVRQVTFGGTRPAQFLGTRAANFAGNVETAFIGTRININFDQSGEGFVKESDPATFTGQFPAQFAGTRAANFAGVVSQNFSGPAPVVVGISQLPVALAQAQGLNNFGVTSNFTINGQFGGSRNYSGSYAGTRPALGSTPGNFGSNAFFGGNVTQNFAGTRVNAGNFGGSRNYAAQYTSANTNFATQFEGVRTYSANFTGNVTTVTSTQFAGIRSFANNYAGSRNFSGQYGGSRNYADQYSGSRNYSAQYAGSRVATSQFLGTTSQTFSGLRPATYTNQYTGQYSSQYTGQFTSQFSNQFTGETIVAVQQTIETYTLYCRVSEA